MATLRAGFAQIDITPPAGTQVAGGVGNKRTAEIALDPLYVRAGVFELGGKKIAIVIFDVTIITQEITDAVRAGVRSLGLAPEAVMVQATQTHTAPGLGVFMLDADFPPIPDEFSFIKGNDPAFDELAIKSAIDAVRQADASLQPAKLGLASGYEGRLAFNRRAVTRDDKVMMPWYGQYQPVGPTFIKYIEGPIDPEVGVLAFRGDDMKLRGVLVHYTCHPVCVYPRPVVSADWPGAVAEELKKFAGPAAFTGVINGCCGDVNPWPFYDPGFAPDHLRMGRQLAELSAKVIETMSFGDPDTLDYRVKIIKLPVREVEPEKLAAAEKMMKEHPTPKLAANGKDVDWEWMKMASAWSVHLLRRRSPLFDYEVQVLRIGDCAIVGMPGEPFAIGGIRVKMASPAKLTITAHLTTQYVGYLPTREAVPRGGHECDTSYWAKFKPEALDLVVDAASGMTKEMWTK